MREFALRGLGAQAMTAVMSAWSGVSSGTNATETAPDSEGRNVSIPDGSPQGGVKTSVCLAGDLDLRRRTPQPPNQAATISQDSDLSHPRTANGDVEDESRTRLVSDPIFYSNRAINSVSTLHKMGDRGYFRRTSGQKW